MSYTKGPLNVSVWDYPRANPPRKELNIQTDQFLVARLAWDEGQDNPYTIPEAEARANAALFAAAPEMFEALAWIAEHDREFGDIEDSETMVYHMTSRAKEALAKAKGVQP